MTKTLSTRLPDGCQWIDLSGQEPPATGMALECDGRRVLSVVPRRGGWLVMTIPAGASQPLPKIVVRSAADGMRWASKWINARSHGHPGVAQAPHAPARGPAVPVHGEVAE